MHNTSPITPISANELLSRKFPPLLHIVPNILTEGLHILAARPKAGKSWGVLELSMAVSCGGEFLGETAHKGTVLYLALEDSLPRIQRRINKLAFRRSYDPHNLFIATQWPRGADGFKALKGWIDQHPDLQLIVIDTLEKIRNPRHGRNDYEDDYNAIDGLLAIVKENHLSIVVVSHTRKANSDFQSDALEQTLGSQGLTGGVDGVMILQRNQSSPHGKLTITGRDIEETTIGIEFDGGFWLRTEAPAPAMPARHQILNLMQQDPNRQWSISELARAANTAEHNIKSYLNDLQSEGAVIKIKRGLYGLPGICDEDKADFINFLTLPLAPENESQEVRKVSNYISEWGKSLTH